jgi:flagellar biosynthetic protein FliR
MVFEVEVFKVFLLVLVRISGMFVSAPVLASSNFPLIAKAGLVTLTALLITPTLPEFGTALPDDPVTFSLMAAGELIIGLMMGFTMTLVFGAIQVAGQLLDMLTGFALMNVFNPALETQVPIFGFFLYILAALYLLALNGHHVMIKAMALSFDRIALGGFVMDPALLREVSTWGKVMFYDGLMIAAPVAGALLLAYVTMGLLGRLVPQIHLFVVGFPITIAMGLLLVALSLSMYLNLLDDMFEQMFRNVNTVMRAMS